MVKEEHETKDHNAVSFESVRPTLSHLILKAPTRLCQAYSEPKRRWFVRKSQSNERIH